MPENAIHSPRISFSHDFRHSDSIPIEQSPLQSSTFNFDFSIPGNVLSSENSLSAEEFFLDGKIIPTEIKKITEPETVPIKDVKPVQEIEEVVSVMDLKPRPLTFLNSLEPGRTKEELNRPIRKVKPVQEIEIATTGGKPDTGSLVWLTTNLDCEIGIGLPLLTDSKHKKKKKKKKNKNMKKKHRTEININLFLDVFLDVLPSESFLGVRWMNFGSFGTKENKNTSMMFDWLCRSLFGEHF